MKTLILSLTAAFGLLATAAAADPAEGRWRTQPDDNGNYGVISMSMCGNTLCGTLVESYNGSGAAIQSANTGRQIVWDMEPRGNGQYRDGQIYAPDRDQTYRSRMDLAGDQLTVSGCVLFICRDQTWTRDN
ncbi:DUF2147 domain-containing protein [Pararhodobacter aggregans]|uniref:DUF2147 domain-containing protein n=1 Tax=Pararhodobacter aggregans TaxID=404875 RepID=A0A2T7UJZ5_9RHOB|nr:DUF2147 domain-containing protein [Pararhodobacter aggregans]PTW98918.1 uncharacterized protein (DUF2147 family) [Pararhodobacter aggregans]PVE44993.1 DUF2147 domain-containing protein [Pararhodobacter aggregans]